MVGGLVEQHQVGGRGELRGEPERPARRRSARRAARVLDSAASKPRPCNTASTREETRTPPECANRSMSWPYRSRSGSVTVLRARPADRSCRASSASRARPRRYSGAAASQTRACRAEVAELVEHRDAKACCRAMAPGWVQRLARDQAEERGFSRPVPAHDAPALAGCDREGDVPEQGADAEADTDATEGKHGHETRRKDGMTDRRAAAPCAIPRFAAGAVHIDPGTRKGLAGSWYLAAGSTSGYIRYSTRFPVNFQCATHSAPCFVLPASPWPSS